jgi:hypothetical protein
MRGAAVIVICFIALTCLTQPAMAQRLEGCSDPRSIATALRKLEKNDWKDMSFARLSKLWPTRLRPLDCDEKKACSSVVSEGRIISGEIECAEVFDFTITHRDDRAEEEQLRGITIHYTARTQDELLSATRLFSDAIGLSNGDKATIGKADSQRFEWEDKTFGRQSAVLELRLVRMGAKWNLFFAFARYPLAAAHDPTEQVK